MSEAVDKLHLEVFSDYVCPWCYLSTPSIEKLQANYPLEIKWVHFPLHPDTPDEGLALSELFRGRDIKPVQDMLKQRMAEEGLPYGDRSKTYNSRLAQELGKWADTQPGGDAIHKAIFQAYFVEDLNIAHIDVLLNIVASVGLDQESAGQVLEQRSFRESVDQDWLQSRSYGISGVPAFVAVNQMVVGCQPYDHLEEFVQYLLQKNS
tara:strand:- start:83328 stop:83948 length:621 start_codon:yes stop_codon:yes gene_type:complete